MSAINPRPNPYVGPRAFETGEKLYGRDREVRELLDHLIAERVVLLYSPSGAGKTSLIRAGLIKELQEEGFNVLPPARVNLEPPSKVELPAGQFNRYIYSILVSLEEDLPEEQQTSVDKLVCFTLEDYLASRPRLIDADGHPKPEVLIFDQFEEILTTNPTDQEGKTAFFAQVGQVLRDRQRWGLFSLREDYVAALDPYLRSIPTRLSNRFRLDLLGAESAMAAIQKPTSLAGVAFKNDAARKLVDDLCKVQVQQPDGSMLETPGNYVEPVQLQVVCYRLWQNLPEEDQDITLEDIAQVGDVNQSLSDYYAERISVVSANSGVRERAIREWFEHKLITEQGIRGQVLMGQNTSEGLDNRAIRIIENTHLIRAEKRRGATWFELAHDRLIRPVRTNNEAWFQANLSLLQRQAALWHNENRPDHLLLREDALQQVEEWASAHKDELTSIENDFLLACQQARKNETERREQQEQLIKYQEKARSARRLQLMLGLAVLAAVAAIFFAVLAAMARDTAQEVAIQNEQLANANATSAVYAQAQSTLAVGNAATAEANAATAQAASTFAFNEQVTANAARGTAQAASTEAIAQRSTADYNAQIAQENEKIAEVNAAEAQRQANLANSRQLAAQSLGYRNTQPDLASLLSIEAYKTANTWEAESVLLTSLQQGLLKTIRPFGRPIPLQEKDVLAVSMSPDGKHLAWGTSDGSVVLWDYERGESEWIKRNHTGNKVTSLAFSPNGSILVSGALDGKIVLTDIASQESRVITNRNNVYSLAFRPDGIQLAGSVGDHILIWDVNTLELLRDLINRQRANCLVWSPDGKLLASGSEDGSVSVWDPAKEIPDLRFKDHEVGILSIDWSPDGKLVASGGKDGDIYTRETANWSQAGAPFLGSSFNWIYSLSFSSDGRLLASGGSNSVVILWDTSTNEQLTELTLHEGIVHGVDFSPVQGQLLLASVGSDNNVFINEIVPQQPLNEPLVNGRGAVIALKVLADGRIYTTRQTKSSIDVSIVQGGVEQQNNLSFNSAVSAAINPDGSQMALGMQDGVIQVVETSSRKILQTLRLPEMLSPVYSLVFNADGSQLASAHCAVKPVSLENGQVVCPDNKIYVWDLITGESKEPLTGHTNIIRALAFDSSGKYLASGSDDCSVIIWNLEYGTPEGLPLQRHSAGITSLAFSPDGLQLASGSADQSLILWDMISRQPIGGPLIGASGRVLSLEYASDSLSLYSGSSDGSILIWDTSPVSWVDRSCNLVGRNMTKSEWEQFMPDLPYQTTCQQFPEGN